MLPISDGDVVLTIRSVAIQNIRPRKIMGAGDKFLLETNGLSDVF
jgi:hypothetical protein